MGIQGIPEVPASLFLSITSGGASRHVWRIPVVFLTARAQRGDQDSALEVGAIACLTKPFDPLTLAGELLLALGR